VTVQPRVGARCATHPARLAADVCPVCSRDRCAPDAAAYADRGCGVCAISRRADRLPGAVEVGVRSGLAALATAVVGGWVVTQHVNVHLMSLIAPALLGLAVCWAATAAGGARSAGQRRLVLLLAAGGAIAGTALGFRLFGRPLTPLHPLHQVGPPYLTALAGVLGWPLLAGQQAPARGPTQPTPPQPTGTRSNR
jgi:hypothetical protein